MQRILVTNDDGVHSEGIHALAAALRPLGDVIVVAPHIEASAIGHALTLRRPLRLEAIADRTFAVDGTPTDCVNVAIAQVFKGLPDLVVSGINKGWNLGDDITYSGTVAGALEGALLGIPSIAVSLTGTGLLPAITPAPGTPASPLIFGPTVFDPNCGIVCGQTLTETFTNTGSGTSDTPKASRTPSRISRASATTSRAVASPRFTRASGWLSEIAAFPLR